MKERIIIGIDPGVKTGIATWDPEIKGLFAVDTVGIIEAFERVLNLNKAYDIKVLFEDARQKKWFGNGAAARAQGAGSVKRDSKIWQEFCEHHKIQFEAVKPVNGQTKWKADYFKKVTGWTGRTSEHARDAAVLVFGIK